MRFIYLSVISSLLVAQCSYAIENTVNKVTFLMPINWTTPERYNLRVTIPEGFRSLQPMDQFGNASTSTIEFVPEKESDYDWNRNITVMKIVGSRLQAGKFSDDLKNSMSKQAHNVRVLEHNVTKGQFFEKAIFALSYDYHAKHEVIGVQYYSGPYDLTGIQYTLRPKKGQSDASALEEIRRYFNAQVEVIN